MSARLYQINHDAGGHLWCGPAAVATVTGHPTSRVLETAKRLTGREAIKSMHVHEVCDTVRELGFPGSFTVSWRGSRPTFTQFRKGRSPRERRTPLILLISTHFVVLAGNRLVDSSYMDPIFATDYHHPRWRVHYSIEVRK